MLPDESNIVSFCFLQQTFFPGEGHSASGRFVHLLACTHCFSSTNFLFDGHQNILTTILIPWVRLLQFWTYPCEQAFDFLAGVLRYRCPHHCPSSWCHPCCEGSRTTWRCHHLRPGCCSFLQMQKYSFGPNSSIFMSSDWEDISPQLKLFVPVCGHKVQRGFFGAVASFLLNVHEEHNLHKVLLFCCLFLCQNEVIWTNQKLLMPWRGHAQSRCPKMSFRLVKIDFAMKTNNLSLDLHFPSHDRRHNTAFFALTVVTVNTGFCSSTTMTWCSSHVDWQPEGCCVSSCWWNDDAIKEEQLTSEISPDNNRYCLCLGFHPGSSSR